MVRVGTYSCVCGAVRMELLQPWSSYGVIKGTSVQCQCHDCYNFAHAVLAEQEKRHADKQDVPKNNNDVDLLSGDLNAVHMMQFYKSDISRVHGTHHLGRLQLKDNSPFIRYYAKCCGTPLMGWAAVGPIIILYAQLLQKPPPGSTINAHIAPIPVVPPTILLHHASAQPGSASPPPGMIVRNGLGFWFVVRVICRIFWGFMVGKVSSPPDAGGPIGIGLESIVLEQRAEPKKVA